MEEVPPWAPDNLKVDTKRDNKGAPKPTLQKYYKPFNKGFVDLGLRVAILTLAPPWRHPGADLPPH